jgi:GDPmannose 4,6-dehydratase
MFGGGRMTERDTKMALITGVLGQDGSYLAELLTTKGYRVIGTSHRGGQRTKLGGATKEIEVLALDLADGEAIRALVKRYRPHHLYNLAARSSSAQLFDDVVATTRINGLAVVHLLEAIRTESAQTRFCQASSSEVFAKAAQSPQNELTPLRPRNAYGAAKVFAQNMVEAYREHHGLFACTAVLFNHESPRRGLNYVTRKITSTAARIKAGLEDSLALGNLDGRRDWSFAGDVVHAMWLMLEQPEPDDFVLASGETHSVRELCELAFGRLGLDYRKHVVVDPEQERKVDAVELRGDSTKARLRLGWRPAIGFKELVYMMVDADYKALSPGPVPGEKRPRKGGARV